MMQATRAFLLVRAPNIKMRPSPRLSAAPILHVFRLTHSASPVLRSLTPWISSMDLCLPLTSACPSLSAPPHSLARHLYPSLHALRTQPPSLLHRRQLLVNSLIAILRHGPTSRTTLKLPEKKRRPRRAPRMREQTPPRPSKSATPTLTQTGPSLRLSSRRDVAKTVSPKTALPHVLFLLVPTELAQLVPSVQAPTEHTRLYQAPCRPSPNSRCTILLLLAASSCTWQAKA